MLVTSARNIESLTTPYSIVLPRCRNNNDIRLAGDDGLCTVDGMIDGMIVWYVSVIVL